MALTPERLHSVFPSMPLHTATAYYAPIVAAMDEFGIDTVRRQAAFLAQILHESRCFTRVSENLNYSAARLMAVWPKRFTDMAMARAYEYQPEALANHVYADREGNGNAGSGDGWRYRGAGLIQLTFKNNHARCAEYFDRDLSEISDWLRTPEGASRSAAWFWHKAGCDARADIGDFDGVCDLINIGRKTERVGDAIGYAERLQLCRNAMEALST